MPPTGGLCGIFWAKRRRKRNQIAMKFDLIEISLVLVVFFAAPALGAVFINVLPYGYTEAAILYLSAIVATGAFWIGRK